MDLKCVVSLICGLVLVVMPCEGWTSTTFPTTSTRSTATPTTTTTRSTATPTTTTTRSTATPTTTTTRSTATPTTTTTRSTATPTTTTTRSTATPTTTTTRSTATPTTTTTRSTATPTTTTTRSTSTPRATTRTTATNTPASPLNQIKSLVDAAFKSCNQTCPYNYLTLMAADSIHETCGVLQTFINCLKPVCYPGSVSDSMKTASSICVPSTSTYTPWRNETTARYDTTKSVTEGSLVNHIKTIVEAAYKSCVTCYSSHLDVLNKDYIYDVCGAFDIFDGCIKAYCYYVTFSDNINDARANCDRIRQPYLDTGLSSAMSCRGHWRISALIFMVTLFFRTL
ncbi:uncharacterized protein LOC106055314 isoform X2 [Biomphalaria glabrata]|uniref:Uncharacterized protein LOC106055314 isoform X2 n=1 Tax=Biomphalaria glabrata TaxID=6526 RepID=A0A9W2ZA73_BIOGL|nr:uncharacterized protein LOC106055314 isoform X2 [Biomphalaria glabrata]